MKKSLLTTNQHLQNRSIREKSMTRNIESSSAIEGISVKRDAVTGQFVSKDSSSTNCVHESTSGTNYNTSKKS